MTSLNRRLFLSGAASVLTLAATSRINQASAAANFSRPTPLYGPEPGIAKLNANENPYGPSKAALEAMNEASSMGAYYVRDSAIKLRQMIAERNGVPVECVTISSGSSGALAAAAIAAAQHGNILGADLFWDTTSKSIERQGLGEIVRLPRHPGLEVDLDAMYAAIDDSIAMVQICNPNNPTGLLSDPDALRAFCIKAATRATVLVDEAYNEVTENPDRNTMVDLVRAGHDVIIARTFSKIYGMAGMRVGYLIAPAPRIAEIERFGIGWYGLNQAGLAGAVASYEDAAFMDASRSKIREAREMVLSAVKENGLTALPSETNFVFVNLGDINADAFRAAMAEQNVMIRGVYGDYTQWSRVSMGYLEHVEMYVKAMPRALAQAASAAA